MNKTPYTGRSRTRLLPPSCFTVSALAAVLVAATILAAGAAQNGAPKGISSPASTALAQHAARLAALPPASVGGTAPVTNLRNALGGESSPYLLEHADDPVAWQPWGAAAFDRARREDKPVFLTIGFSACHWCHVMQREDFKNADIARYLNDHFVCVAVDREQRPDLDDIYISAVEAMTGSGGWPLSVFLTPDRKPFAGGTYFPPAEFQALLTRVVQTFRDHRPDINHFADRVAAALDDQSPAATAAPIPPEVLKAAEAAQVARYDAVNGGFGSRPKFLEAPTLSFLLERYLRTGEAKLLEIVTNTLSHLADGGVRDQLGGGFHRYSTDAAWRIPHFEKMLYDQALMASVYLEAFRVSGQQRFRDVAADTLNFATGDMRDPDGGFYSSMDADSDGREGAYYLWTPAQVRNALGPGAALFDRAFGVSPEGEVNGGSVLAVTENAGELARSVGLTTAGLDKRLAALRAKTLEVRERRDHPPIDKKILASWNGLMISALSEAYRATHDSRYRSAAQADASFVLKHMMVNDVLMHSWRAGKAEVPGLLDDYAGVASGFLDLGEAVGDPAWVLASEKLANEMVTRFGDPGRPGFFSSPGSSGLIARRKNSADSAAPSGNGMAIGLFARLANVTGEANWRQLSLTTADGFAPLIAQAPGAYLSMLTAVSSLGAPGRHVIPAVVQATAATPTPLPGQVIGVELHVRIMPGWHINAHVASAAYLIPTAVSLEPGSAYTLLDVVYPPGQPTRLAAPADVLSAYQGTVKLIAHIRASAAPTDPARVRPRQVIFVLSYQACSDRSCLAPARLPVSVAVDVHP